MSDSPAPVEQPVEQHKQHIRQLVPRLWMIRHNALYTTDAWNETMKRVDGEMKNNHPIFYAIHNNAKFAIASVAAGAVAGYMYRGNLVGQFIGIGSLASPFLSYLQSAQYINLSTTWRQARSARDSWEQVWNKGGDIRMTWHHDYQNNVITCHPYNDIKAYTSMYQQAKTNNPCTYNQDYQLACTERNANFEKQDIYEGMKDFQISDLKEKMGTA